MSLLRLCLGGLSNEDTWAWNSPCRQGINISELSRKLWNREHFTQTFPKQPQPGRRKTPRPSELQATIPRCDKRNLEDTQKTAHKWTRCSLRKLYQRHLLYLTVKRQAPFRRSYTPKTHPEKAESTKSKDVGKQTVFKEAPTKNTGPEETAPESKKIVNDKSSTGGNEADQTPSESLHERELSEEPKPKSQDSTAVFMQDPIRNTGGLKNSKETAITSIRTKEESKDSKNNSDAKLETCSINSPDTDLQMYLEESGVESMEFGMWLENYSQNNSKKASKKEAKKSSEAESADSTDAKKEKKTSKKDSKKKEAKKDAESTDVESADSKDTRKESKKSKKDSKKGDKKEAKKDAESTDVESEPDVKLKMAKKGSKKERKDSKKDDKKKDAGSTDADSEPELKAKGKRIDQKPTRGSKKDAKEQGADKGMESSTSGDSDALSRRGSKKFKMLKTSDTESEESVHTPGAQKRRGEASGPTSAESKRGTLGQRRESKTSFKKTTFQGQAMKTCVGRWPRLKEGPPLPPCEPMSPPPKPRRLCRCKMLPSSPKPRHAPLPEAKWIWKLL